MLSVALTVMVAMSESVAFSTGEMMETAGFVVSGVGGGVLSTVTVIGSAVVLFPARSYAIAVSVWVPSVTVVVSKESA